MTAGKERAMLVREVFEESGLSGPLLASDAGVSENSFWSWLTGRRLPSPDSLNKLANGLRSRAHRLEALAERLERAADAEV